MGFLDNLNFLATIGTFACVSFALSGMGVKLGKLSSEPHRLGFSYISTSSNKDKLYEATAKLNENSNSKAPEWAKNKETLIQKCKDYEKSTRKWYEVSQHCLIRNNVWHQLIEKGVTLKSNLPENKETAQSQPSGSVATPAINDKCTYEILNSFADGDDHVNFLIGKSACFEAPKPASTQASASPQIGDAQ